jgi:hypothetical protein
MDNPIKILVKESCPHCNKEILIEVKSLLPTVDILTIEDIEESKNIVITKLEESYLKKKITKKELNDAMEWVNSEETVFGPNDIDTVVDSIINNPKG